MRNNSPIDICSHKRSGTHFLMATLWYNFELPDLTVTTTMVAGKLFKDYDGLTIQSGEVARIRWGGLWLSHGSINASMDLGKTVYVVRDPVPTLMSFWKFSDPLMKAAPSRFIGHEAVANWYKQALGYLLAGCLVIRYEDFVGAKHDDVLSLLESQFGLKRRWKRFERFRRKIGWYSAIQPQQADEPPELLLNAIDEYIPNGFLGYNIGA